MRDADRHSRHRRFAPVGDAGQRRLASARVAVVGCGALGSHAAELLARAGVATAEGGLLRLIDRDYVDVTNLQRQALYDESDAAAARPKALAARRHLAAIDASVRVEAVVRDLNPSNAESLLGEVDLVVDGTDNFRTRFLINDVAVKLGTPWIYGAAVGSRGMVSVIVPGATPCLRCLLGEVPPFGANESCDTAGIITPLPAFVAAMQVAAAMRWLVAGARDPGLTTFDLWNASSTRTVFPNAVSAPDCPTCGSREFPSLNEEQEQLVTLCGRNSVQIHTKIAADLGAAADRFGGVAVVHRHPQSITAEIPEGALTLFDDGRVIVEGTTDTLEARSIVARYLGG